MTSNDKKSINQIILVLLTPPLFFLAIDLLRYAAGIDGSSSFMHDEIVNVIHPPLFFLLLSFLPYPIAFYFRHNENIFFITKLAISAALAVNLLEPFAREYELSYCLLVTAMTGLGTWGLSWNAGGKRKVDFGEYPLALDTKGRTGFPTSSLHENVQIVGGTGTGKTHYAIKPFIQQTIHQGLGCFILDVKSNMFKDVAYYSSQTERRRVFHFNLDDILHSHSYNPLYGDNADAIANRVFAALYYDTRNTERYYVELADAFLHNLIALLKKEIKSLTFQDLLTATQEVENFRTIKWFCAQHPKTPQAAYFRDQWLDKSPKDRRMELSGLTNKLQRFCNNEWAQLLNVREPDIRMERIVGEGQIFLFSPASARYPEDAKALSILAMMDLSEQVADRYQDRPKEPFRVFLDEFYNLAYPKFIDFINKCREAQVNLFLAHQSLGDLRGVSLEFQEQVMNTASNKIILRVNDPDTAEVFARQFGTERDTDYKVESYAANGDVMGYSKPPVEKFRFHPNRIKELKVGQAIVKIVGSAGVHVFEISLKPAETIPSNFHGGASLHEKHFRKGENQTSIPDLLTKVEKDPPKTPIEADPAPEYGNAF